MSGWWAEFWGVKQIKYNVIGERVKRARHSRGNGGVCLFIYVCGRTNVILYFDPHIFVFALWSTLSSDPVLFKGQRN